MTVSVNSKEADASTVSYLLQTNVSSFPVYLKKIRLLEKLAMYVAVVSCMLFMLASAGIEDDSTKAVTKNKYDFIRIKIHYLQDNAELSRLAGNPRIIRIVKDSMKKAVDIIQKTVKVERLTKPLLISRPCKSLTEKRFLKEKSGRPRKYCEKACHQEVTCPGGMVIPKEHLDDCYIKNRGASGMDHGNGIPNVDLVVYVMAFKHHVKHVMAASLPCVLEPTAKDRPIAGAIYLSMDCFGGHYIRITKPHGYHAYIHGMIHQLIHIFGFYRNTIPFFRVPENGKPSTSRAANFPYLPNLGVVDDLTNKSMFDGINYFYKPDPKLLKINADQSADWKGKKSVKAAKTYFNCQTLKTIHFRAPGHSPSSKLIGDTMSAVFDELISPPGRISMLTAAFLEDSGWYKIADSRISTWQGGTSMLGCEFAKSGCKTFKGWPCCTQEDSTGITCSTDFMSKGVCLKPFLTDRPMFRVMYMNETIQDELWKYLAPFCRYPSWTPQASNNILWEKPDQNSGFCFQFGRQKTKMDASKLPATLEPGYQKKYFDGTKFLSGCYKVDCNVQNGYKVYAAYGEPQLCQAAGRGFITFEHNGRKVGPFRCWGKSSICQKETYPSFEVPA